MDGGEDSISQLGPIKAALLLQFWPTREGNVCEKFLVVKYEGSVVEFKRNFEALVASITGISGKVMEGIFINGLKPDVRAEVRVLGPKGFGQIMDVAQRVEDQNNLIKMAKR